MKRYRLILYSLGIALGVVLTTTAPASAIDVFRETFDNRQDGVTMDGFDSWEVASGSASSAIAQSNITFSGEGKSLKIANAPVPVQIERPGSYGGLSPAWIEMVVRPGMGNQASAVPANGIGAICFDSTGKILVSDGTSWTDSGKTFDASTWYRVLMKVDFTNRVYSLYVSPAAVSKIPFVPDKENLHFINPSINSISKFGFGGVYSSAPGAGDTYVDEMTVHFVQRLSIVTAAQNLVKNHASNAITVQMHNADAEPQTAWKDITLDVRSSSSGGEFSMDKTDWNPVSQIVIPAGANQVTFYYKDSNEGKPVITLEEAPDQGWGSALQQMNVANEGQFFEISTVSPQIAGRPFEIQIIAKDADGNPDRFYGGTLNLTAKYIEPGSGTKTIAPYTATGFREGVLSLPVSYADAGIIQIEAEDQSDGSKKGVSGQVTFAPAGFRVTAQSPAQTVAKPFMVNVAALAEGGEVTPNYQGPVALRAVGVLPANTLGGTFTPTQLETASFEGGQAEATASYDRWGKIRLEVQDTAKPTQVGESEDIDFAPAGLSVKIKEPPAGRDFYYTGESVEAVLSVNDANKKPVRNFEGNLELTATPEMDLPAVYPFVGADSGQKSILFTPDTANTYVLKTALPNYNLSTESTPLKVKQATIEVLSTVAPIGTTEVQIQLVDEKGRRITSENKLAIQLFFQESDPDNSVFLTSPGKPILFHNGLAKVVIGNTQAETVTIAPSAGSGFKVKSGTVVFGRVGKSGIGALMLLESKDDLASAENGNGNGHGHSKK